MAPPPIPPAPSTLETEQSFQQYIQDIQQSGLVGLAPVIESVRTIIWSGQVAGERPVSAIICAPIGHGKTSVLKKVVTPVAKFLTDFTSRDMPDIVKDKDITHIMIGDLLAVLKHKAATVQLSTRLLATMSGDEIMKDQWTGADVVPRQIGVITAIPPEEMYNRKLASILWSGGFASRYIIVRYSYTDETVQAIHNFIMSDAYVNTKPFFFNVEQGRVLVKIPEEIAKRIFDLAEFVKNDELGARAHHHLRALCKAAARQRQSNVVEECDFNKIRSLAKFFTTEGKTI